MNNKISVVIISKNAENTIGRTLRSLNQFSEVVVLDTGSTDNTKKIVQSYHNTRLFEDKFEGFGKSKNKAVSLATYDWILSVDADEVLTPALISSIKQLNPELNTVYRFKRNNFYRKIRIKHSGWGKDYLVRLFNRTETCFIEKLVHEHVNVDHLKVATINGVLNHYTYHSLSDFSRKREFYSDLFAIENAGKRKASPLTAFLHAFYGFLHTFFMKRGFLDGYIGLYIAASDAYVTFSKYMKLYEANLELLHTVAETKSVPDLSTVPG